MTNGRGEDIIITEKGVAGKRLSPSQLKVFKRIENRHLPGWRFSRSFTIIVIVYRPICRVIRIGNTPLRGIVA